MPRRSYWLDLFTGKTWEEARQHGFRVSGFRDSRWNALQKVKPGDFFLCYLTGVSRFIGVLEVTSEAFRGREKVWSDEDFPCRVKVKPVVTLEPETAIPIQELRDQLSIFRDLKSPRAWTGHVRGSPQKWSREDGEVIVQALLDAQANPTVRAVDQRKLQYRPRALRSKIGPVTVPDKEEERPVAIAPELEPTEHLRIQSLLLKLGGDMGLSVWIARNDRNREVGGKRLCDHSHVVHELPLQFHEAVMKTIELIDVLWLKGKSIKAAFEIECTTSIYSGLLRLADLISMQPNLTIPLYIVAPDERRSKVMAEINRATFARLDPPMPEICSFLAFSTLDDAMLLPDAARKHLRPDYLDAIAESCEAEEA